jgi:hypothetical protein
MHLISDYTLWLLLPIALISASLTLFYYQKQGWFNDLKKSQQYLFKTLRFGSLFLVGTLLLGLILQVVSYREEKPIFISLIDNSNSMLNYRDSTQVKNQINHYRNKLSEKFNNRFELIELYVGSKVSNEKLSFKEKTSRLEAGFDKINEDYYNRNIGGITFISDGNYNIGTNPSYAAEKISFTPIFTLAVGDTTQRKDQAIKNISVNEIAFLNNEFPVEIDLEAIKLPNRTTRISITENGKTVASQVVTYGKNKKDFKQLNFTLKANKIGFQSYTVKLESLNGEFTYKNNQRTFYMEVIDSRNKVLLIAGAPHPDIATLKEVLDQNENIESESVLIKDWNKSLEKTDLIVWHDPGVNFDPTVLDLIQQKNIPVFYILGPNTENTIVTKLKLGLSVNRSNQTADFEPTFTENFNDFELSEKAIDALEFYPPLKAKFGAIKFNGNPTVLLSQRIGQIKNKEPLLFFINQNNQRNGILYGEGIWRWKLNDFVRNGNHEAFSELFAKTMNYLMVKQQDAGLRIEFPKRFTTEDEIIVNASFFNASLEPITKPQIQLKITDASGKEFKSQFGINDNGYKLSLGKMKGGKYNWTAFTKFNGKSYRKSGVFVVEEIELEKLETSANHGVMLQLAKQSNGKFYELNEYNELLNELENREDITTMSFEETTFNKLIDYWSVLIILFIFLGAEWFLRRYFGTY